MIGEGKNTEAPTFELVLGSASEFAQRLEPYTQLPSERVEEFLGWSEQEIRHEARSVTEVLKRFAEAVAQSMGGQTGLDDFLIQLDLRIISRDHDWRTIFAAMRDYQAPDSGALKHTTVAKYLQYLSFRKRLLDFIYLRKSALAETGELSSAHPGHESLSTPAASAPNTKGLSRLPIAESVVLTLRDGEVLELVMGRHWFELVGGSRPYLVDENGVTCFMRAGRNMIGRHPESDVVIDGNFGNVSRVHVILDWDGVESFTLMDLSSRGTWLKDEVLREAMPNAADTDA